MNQRTKQIIIAVVVIIIAFFGFQMFFGTGSSSSNSTLATDNATQQFVDGQTILTLLNRLNQVTLNGAIFSDPVFNSLVSFEQPIPDQIPGRTNPFAPIGTNNASTISLHATSTSSLKVASTTKTQ